MKRTTLLAVSALVVAALLAVACEPGDPGRSTGAYPIEIFPEMHYNPSFKAQQPPRLHPPEDSIPVSGAVMPVGDKATERDRPNPLPQTAEVIEYGALLYQRDCSMCHGRMGGGDGPAGVRLVEYGVPAQPPALDSSRIQDLTPGEAFSSISVGFGFMPPFISLLTEEERWAIVTLIEAPAAEREAALEAARGLWDQPENRASRRLVELGNR